MKAVLLLVLIGFVGFAAQAHPGEWRRWGRGGPRWDRPRGPIPEDFPNADACQANYFVTFSNGNSAMFYITRTGGNSVSAVGVLNQLYRTVGTGTCDLYPDGTAKLSLTLKSPAPQHTATITADGKITGHQTPGFEFSGERQ